MELPTAFNDIERYRDFVRAGVGQPSVWADLSGIFIMKEIATHCATGQR